MANRRAFLLAGATFAVGTWLGIEGGYAVGARVAVAPAAPPDLPPTDDQELDELRRLAVQAPLASLLEHRLAFANAIATRYGDDAILWCGMRRLCEAVLADPAIADRRRFARFLAQMIELAPAKVAAPLQDCAPRLRGIR